MLRVWVSQDTSGMNCIQWIQSQHLPKCSLATCASIYSICIADPSWLAQQMCMKCPLIFQFHKGAIETWRMRTAIASTRSFNSIKERLKPAKIQYLASSIRVSTHAPTWSATSTTALTMRELTFQSTRPRGARPHFHGLLFVRDFVSIHAPTWGATADYIEDENISKFQSTRPRGARHVKKLMR